MGAGINDRGLVYIDALISTLNFLFQSVTYSYADLSDTA